jgi:RNA polymerase sigma factor (sigma-70 family)
MARRRPNAVLQHLHKLLAVQTTQALSDRDLLDRFIAQHDEAAFAALVERHGAMVLGTCRRLLRNAHDAEDASQAAFLVLARKAASIRKQESLAGWLHGVACHVAANLKREAARRSAREASRQTEPAADAAVEVSWREMQGLLDEELARLPEHYRSALVLCYLEGKTRDEAARQLGWSLTTLRGRLDRARERLRARLTRRGLTLSAALLAAALAESSTSAALPATFVVHTVRAGLLHAAGQVGAAGGGSARVAALVEGALKGFFAARTKAGMGTLAAVLVVGIGIGVVASTRSGSEQTLPPLVQGHEPGRETGRPPVEAAIPTPPPVQVGKQDVPTDAVQMEPRRIPHRFLDLRPHANQKLKDNFANQKGNDLAGLPTGEQELAGVKFNIGEGLVQLTGRGTPHPEKVEGIKVGARFSRLHILHATQWEDEKHEGLVGYYRVNYEDQSRETIPIVYGRDTSDWWYRDDSSKAPSGAKVAWKGANESARTTREAKIRLYLTSWKNPEPARTVVSIDFASTNSMAAPFCVAMTAEE